VKCYVNFANNQVTFKTETDRVVYFQVFMKRWVDLVLTL